MSPVRVARFHLAFGILSFLLGFALVLGGPTRASAYCYNVITIQGGVYVWGTVFMVLGVGLIVSVNLPEMMSWLLLAGVVAYTVLSLAFLAAAITHPTANYTGQVAYGWIAAMHWCAFTKTRRAIGRSHRLPRKRDK